MPGARLRGAVVGCGFFAVNHLEAWRDLADEVELVALADLDRGRAEAMAARFGIGRADDDPARMLDETAPDFVDIVTTMESHRALVELAAARGVPVIVQKPIAPALADAEAMVAACERAGVPLMVHENFRFQRPVSAVRDVLASGRIGRPFFARISWRTGHDVFQGQPYLARVPRLIILDLVIHLLDVARALLGEVETLACRTARVRRGIAGEDAAALLLGHAAGGTTVIDATYSARRAPDPFPETLIEIDGDRGSLRLAPGYRLCVIDREGPMVADVAPEAPAWAIPPWQAIQESVVRVQRHWTECLRTGATPATSGRDNLETFRLVEAAYASAAAGSTVRPGAMASADPPGRAS
ncbi:MAG TPA: Gfo/Idh/MocA family oxidoreductase [Geminicoccaceae bacterium]